MSYPTDHDGKSTTASAVDLEHYPEQSETADFARDPNSILQHDQIAARAFQLWLERGCPEGSADEDWHRAEAELRVESRSNEPVRSSAGRAGSFQS